MLFSVLSFIGNVLIDHPNIKIEDMFKLVRKDVINDTGGQQVPWENTSLNTDFFFNTMTQDEISETIYQSVRNYYCAETLICLSNHFGYTISDIMRIYQRQKSEKPGGIYYGSTKPSISNTKTVKV